MSDGKYFFCYSKSLFLFLKKRGIKEITTAMTLRDRLVFSLFKRDDELNQALFEWDEHKQRQDAEMEDKKS